MNGFRKTTQSEYPINPIAGLSAQYLRLILSLIFLSVSSLSNSQDNNRAVKIREHAQVLTAMMAGVAPVPFFSERALTSFIETGVADSAVKLTVTGKATTLLIPIYQEPSCNRALKDGAAQLRGAAIAWTSSHCVAGVSTVSMEDVQILPNSGRGYTVPTEGKEPVSSDCLQLVDDRCVVHCASGSGPIVRQLSRFEATMSQTITCTNNK